MTRILSISRLLFSLTVACFQRGQQILINQFINLGLPALVGVIVAPASLRALAFVNSCHQSTCHLTSKTELLGIVKAWPSTVWTGKEYIKASRDRDAFVGGALPRG